MSKTNIKTLLKVVTHKKRVNHTLNFLHSRGCMLMRDGPLFTEWCARFTTVPCKPLTKQGCRTIIIISPPSMIPDNSGLFKLPD